MKVTFRKHKERTTKTVIIKMFCRKNRGIVTHEDFLSFNPGYIGRYLVLFKGFWANKHKTCLPRERYALRKFG